MPKIIFDKTSYTYAENTPLERRALIDIDLSIEKGTFHSIIGHTGSGKSTLIKHINGLLKANSGAVIVNGYQIKNTRKAQKELLNIRKNASIVFQFPELQLFAETVEKDIMFGPKNFGASDLEAKKLAEKYIRLVGLTKDLLHKSPFELSGGQKRRVAIAGILAIQPEILVIDEPTAGLDPVGKKDIMNIIKNLHNLGQTIILVTHNMNDVWKYSDSLTLLNNGKIVFSGTPETLFTNEDFLAKNSIDMPIHIKFIKKIEKKLGIKIPYSFIEPEKIINVIKEQIGAK